MAIPVLPLHGPRRIGRRDGDRFLAGDYLATVHAQTQAVWDIRRLVRWAREQGAPAVGIQGISLGGYTTALTVGVEPRLAGAIAGIPGVDFLSLGSRNVPLVFLRRWELSQLRSPHTRRMMRVVSPLALSPQVPRERLFIYAGLGDRLTPPSQALALWEHWSRPELLLFPGGHVSFFGTREIGDLKRRAFSAMGLSVA